VPAVKAREDPTIAATAINRLTLKRCIYVPFLNSVLVDGISAGDWIVSHEEYDHGLCGHGRSSPVTPKCALSLVAVTCSP
jgi:hypothetical protein